MTTNQKELRKYLLYLSDKMTPEEALVTLGLSILLGIAVLVLKSLVQVKS